MSVPGVGPITALTFTSTIEDPHRFVMSAPTQGSYPDVVSLENATSIATSPRQETLCCVRRFMKPPTPRCSS